ncbi:exodeoxyribonuclease V subunit beta [Opitutales bacterium]|nr:exodeoxyribonuclease V subunit beta [Opitutales bacterium]
MKPFDCTSESLDKGVTLLEASAGTGKTYALARIFLRLVVEEGVEVGKLLTVTFTSAATEELRGRIRELLVLALASLQAESKPDEDQTIKRLRDLGSVSKEECIRRLRLAITCFDEAIISTIHGFCHRVLAENSLETNCLFDAELDKSTDHLILDAVRDYWRINFCGANPLVSAVVSIEKIKTDSAFQFYKKLPSTQGYEIGFNPGMSLLEAQDNLLRVFNDVGLSWVNAKEDYLNYVSSKIYKYTAYKKVNLHTEILDRVFIQGETVTPDLIEIFEFVREAKLKPLKDFRDEVKPEFAILAEEFWQSIENFSQALRIDCVSFINQRLSGWKGERGILSFDDLLSITATAILRKDSVGEQLRESLRSSFEVAMIDEFQDTDPVQFTIFRELFAGTGRHWLFLIGDPKQSIYRFRGADLEAYFDFGRKTEGRKFSLETNFRTVAPLVNATNEIFKKSSKPFLHDDLLFKPVKPNLEEPVDQSKLYLESGNHLAPLEIRELKNTGDSKIYNTEARKKIIHDMINQIFKVLGSGEIGTNRVKPENIAILVRSNPQALEVWEVFRSFGLPAVVFSDISLFASVESKELLWVLEGMVDCRNERSVRRALATGLLGMKTQDFLDWQKDSWSWDAWLSCFRLHLELWRKEGIYVAVISLLRRARALSQNLRRPDGERRVTNFLHLAEVLHQASSCNPMSPNSLVVWLRDQIEQSAHAEEEYQLRLESESTAIQILTVHKSKGLEYPIVFVPFLGFSPGRMDEGFFYHDHRGQLVVDLKKSAGIEASVQGMLEEDQEDARVLYVAITRAASRCVIYHAPVPINENKYAQQLKIPALTRILRSQVSSENEELSSKDWKENKIESEILYWIEKYQLENFISFNSFSGDEDIKVYDWKESSTLLIPQLSGNTWPVDRKIPNGVLLRSFSGLVQRVDFDGRDLDAVQTTEDGGTLDHSELADKIFEFPAGAEAGTFMHEVFEEIDFQDSRNWKKIIQVALEKYGFDSNKWLHVIYSMTQKVINSPLQSGFSLGDVYRGDRVEEMEFHFPIRQGVITQLAGELPDSSFLGRYLRGLAGDQVLQIESQGYLKGLIDLIFRFDDKYFLLDWKSNRLNGRADGFGPLGLESEMLDHHYVLQYHLYLVGLLRFLRGRIEDFDYKTHFGGVYYLFLRGMGEETDQGIFFDFPEQSVIEKLENFLCQR